MQLVQEKLSLKIQIISLASMKSDKGME